MILNVVFSLLGLVLLGPPIFSLTDEMKELADMLHQTCIGETGVSEDAILNARKGQFSEEDAFKCYIKCVMAQMGCIDEEGIVDVEATIAVLPEEVRDAAEPVIKKCGTQRGSSACDNAWMTHRCYYAEAPESYFLV